MINLNSQYPTKTAAPDANYTYGSARNITTPGDGTGTPWEQALVNDIVGFQQALVDEAGIVPSGSPETVLASDQLDALFAILQSVRNPFINRALFRDEKADGVDGGTFTAGAWQTRDLQEIYNNISGSSIAANVITLPVGTYIFKGSAPCSRDLTVASISHQAAIYNVTGASFPSLGTSEYINPGSDSGAQTRSFINSPPVVLGVQSDIELRHQITITVNTTGFGIAGSFGEGEVYSELEIWKIA